jgi:hypothetical protein
MAQTLQVGSRNLGIENWKVLHKEGHHMFTCSERKAMWYLRKNLARIVEDEEYTIQLTFESKGYGFGEDEIFGLAGREVRCVVTGEKEGLQRHHIVPYCYRTHFPNEYKSKNHHDVVLVTYRVHEEYERYAFEYKNEMARIYNVPTLNQLNLRYTKLLSEYSSDKVKMLSRLHSIFKNNGNIPVEIIKENLRHAVQYTDLTFEEIIGLNYVQLYKLYLILRQTHQEDFEKFKEVNSIKYDHGYHVVSKLDTHEKLEEFVKMWRTHFIETMEPQYMPVGWSVDFRVKVEL